MHSIHRDVSYPYVSDEPVNLQQFRVRRQTTPCEWFDNSKIESFCLVKELQYRCYQSGLFKIAIASVKITFWITNLCSVMSNMPKLMRKTKKVFFRILSYWTKWTSCFQSLQWTCLVEPSNRTVENFQFKVYLNLLPLEPRIFPSTSLHQRQEPQTFGILAMLTLRHLLLPSTHHFENARFMIFQLIWQAADLWRLTVGFQSFKLEAMYAWVYRPQWCYCGEMQLITTTCLYFS